MARCDRYHSETNVQTPILTDRPVPSSVCSPEQWMNDALHPNDYRVEWLGRVGHRQSIVRNDRVWYSSQSNGS